MSNVRALRDTLPIVKGIPVPPQADRERTQRLVKTLRACAIGDSFLWPENRKIYGIAKRHSLRVTLRPCDGGFRVWRIA